MEGRMVANNDAYGGVMLICPDCSSTQESHTVPPVVWESWLEKETEKLWECLARHLEFHTWLGREIVSILGDDDANELCERGGALMAEVKSLVNDEQLEEWRERKKRRDTWPFAKAEDNEGSDDN
jgi:hypothetical protein